MLQYRTGNVSKKYENINTSVHILDVKNHIFIVSSIYLYVKIKEFNKWSKITKKSA